MQKAKFDKYLKARINYPAFIPTPPEDDLAVIVVIPLCAEKSIESVLRSLYRTTLSHQNFEVILVVNQPIDVSDNIREINQQCLLEVAAFRNRNQLTNLHSVFLDGIPVERAGVGHARKAGMDEAVRRFWQLGRTNGIITCMDGDAYVKHDYLQTCYDLYLEKEEVDYGYSFNFCHPLTGSTPEEQAAIVSYELHLRYFKHVLAWAGHPHSIYTVGSSMACRALGYIKQGGMNERKAGEDFYFMQMFAKANRFRWHKKIVVLPSARVSDRVPFGTGRAMINFKQNGVLTTYDFRAFQAIKAWLDLLPRIHAERDALLQNQHIGLNNFFSGRETQKIVLKLCQDATDTPDFYRRFFVWFDAFKAMKLIHYLRDNCEHDNGDILQNVNAFMKAADQNEFSDQISALTYFRKLDGLPSAQEFHSDI